MQGRNHSPRRGQTAPMRPPSVLIQPGNTIQATGEEKSFKMQKRLSEFQPLLQKVGSTCPDGIDWRGSPAEGLVWLLGRSRLLW